MDVISAALKVAERIVDRAALAVTNAEECKLLASLAGQTKPFLQRLEQLRLDDPSLLAALDLILDALNEADRVIEDCCKSTVLIGMIFASRNSAKLKHVNQRLQHALQKIPLATLPAMEEMRQCMFALQDNLRKAKFNSVAVSTHQTRVWKDEMEKAFNKNLEGTEEMKTVLVDMMKEHSRTVEAKLQDLDVLKNYMREARREKDQLLEYELKHIIDAINESLKPKEQATASDLSADVLDQLCCCPISKEVMKDPVVLKDSGVTYERASIEDWLRRGNKKDPVTETEIKSYELIPNLLAKSLVSFAIAIDGSEKHQTETEKRQPRETELYEGRGQHTRAENAATSGEERNKRGDPVSAKHLPDSSTQSINTAPLGDGNSYKKVKDICSGEFAFVHLAQDKHKREQYAVKCIERGKKIDKHVFYGIMSRRNLLHHHVIQFEEVYLTPRHLCIVTEYAPGGDLFYLVKKKNGLSEKEARWFFQQLIIGLDYCHQMGVVCRDIKLEHALLDGSQWPLLKICGFKYSKHEMYEAPDERVGTPAYMAPEVITAKGQMYDGKKADIWSCGVFLYVMIFASYPFDDTKERSHNLQDELKLKRMITRIVEAPLTIPDHPSISPDLEDLLYKIMVKDPTQRIDMKGIMKHRWFQTDLPEGAMDMNKKLQTKDSIQSEGDIRAIVEDARIPIMKEGLG